MIKTAIVISCEHASNAVPAQYSLLFKPYEKLLNTHQGIDFGALAMAKHMHEEIKSTLFTASATRLLIDCNRQLKNPGCFSHITKSLSKSEKKYIESHYYTPYRSEVERFILAQINRGYRVIHLSIHSFTPILNGNVRTADIGFLYDSRRNSEKILAQKWRQLLSPMLPKLKMRMNYPYLGKADGFTSYLRKFYNEQSYLGLELEFNQSLFQNPSEENTISKKVSQSFQHMLENYQNNLFT